MRREEYGKSVRTWRKWGGGVKAKCGAGGTSSLKHKGAFANDVIILREGFGKDDWERVSGKKDVTFLFDFWGKFQTI